MASSRPFFSVITDNLSSIHISSPFQSPGDPDKPISESEMVAKTSELPCKMEAEEPQLVTCPEFSLKGMEKYLQTEELSDFKIICNGHVFNVHRLMIAKGSAYLRRLISGDLGPGEFCFDRYDPAIIARFIYFLYTGSYPVSHIAHLKVKSFITLSDDLVVAGRLDALHVEMYSSALTFCLPQLASTASLAFRSLGHEEFCKAKNWPALAERIYDSTTPKYRELRNIVVREIQYATHHDRSRINIDDLKEAISKTPALAMDLATIPLTKGTQKCSNCWQAQYVLILPCFHIEKHSAEDNGCFKLGLMEQECFKCHATNVFK